jgi:hypothetical protein
MLESLFVGAARDLRKHGWTQPSGDNALLFHHPEFGTHEFFKACYIQTNAERIRRRQWWVARIRPATYSLLGAIACGVALYYYYLKVLCNGL